MVHLVSFPALRNPLLFIEIAVIVGMLATLLLPPLSGAIMVWSSIPALLYIRAAFWIVGLCVLPGLYLVRLIPPLSAQSLVVRIVVAMITSFAILGTLTMVVDVAGFLFSLPGVAITLVAALAAFSWYRGRGSTPVTYDLREMHKGYIVLIAAAAASIIVAALFQNGWHYLYPQDTWVSLTAGIKLISGRSIAEIFKVASYPVAFGYIIAGLSVCTGLPIVNTQALLLPFTALEVLTLFSLARVVFGRGIYTSAIASLIFGFCGGLGWVVLFSITNFLSMSNWPNYFMYISNVTRDMYFGPFFFYSFFFYYKSLALVMALGSIAIFSLSGRAAEIKWKVLLAVMSSLLMVWAFLIHMLPALLAPMILVVALLSKERRQHLKSFLALAVSATVLLLAMDLMMGRIYTSLVIDKVQLPLSAITSGRLMIYGIGLAALLAAAVAAFFLLRRRTIRTPPKSPLGPYTKPAVVLALLAIFLTGGLFFNYAPYSVSYSDVFSWHLYVTRYGLIGILALIGLYTSRWKAEWLKICVVWSIVAIAMGSVWWGERLNSFLFPMMAILAGAAIVNIASRASRPRTKKVVSRPKAGRRDPRLVLATASLLVLLALSFTSPVIGAYNFLSAPPLVTDDMVLTYNWVSQNTSHDSKYLTYPYPYTLHYGILTLAERGVTYASYLDPFTVSQVPDMVANLSAKGIQYIVRDPTNPFNTDVSSVINILQSYSDISYRSGNITVSRIPLIAMPSNISSTVACDWGQSETLRFLAISIPALWPTGYSVVNDTSLARNASVVVAPYNATMNSTILSLREGATVVLINSTLTTPDWGTGWGTLFPGTLAGTYEGRRIFIVNSGAPQLLGNLTAFSHQLYDEIVG